MHAAIVRHMRFQAVVSGDREIRFNQVKQIMGFASDAETAQYLINRGIEACAPVIRNWVLLKEVTDRTMLQQSEFFDRMADVAKEEEGGRER